jgi:AAA family ATP:ADP antiporter
MAERDEERARQRDPAGLRRLVGVRPGEGALLLLSAAYFFLILAAYYALRPLREAIGAEDRDHLNWLWTGTFVAVLAAVPAYSAVARRRRRGALLPLVYRFFALNLFAFWGAMLLFEPAARIWVDRGFYVWTSVFNLLAVSMLWSLMADVFQSGQAKRLFGIVAAGGTLGGILGSGLSLFLVRAVEPAHLLLVSLVLLEGAARCVLALDRRVSSAARAGSGAVDPDQTRISAQPIGGGVWTGIATVFRSPYLLGISAYLLLFTTTSSFLYFEQAHVVGRAITDPAERAALFSGIDLAVNVLALFGQLFLAGRAMRRLGVALTLAALPALTGAGFLALGALQTLAVLVVFQVARRAGNFVLAKPAREVLFTVVGREEKYKSKAFVDTVVYRGGDLASAWVFDGLLPRLGLAGIALLAAPVSGAWLLVGLWLGRRQERRARLGERATPLAPAPDAGP